MRAEPWIRAGAEGIIMKRGAVLLYGVAAYVMFFCVFLYAVGFIGGFLVPTRLDAPALGHPAEAAAVNVLLIVIFGLQHSVMARPAFKRWWTQFIPQPIERSTYVLATNFALCLLFWQWRPMGRMVWEVTSPVGQTKLWIVFAMGWLTVFVTSHLINHFDLFGLRQVWLYFRERPYTPLSFVTPWPYRVVRHPLYVGWLMAFWATPTMSMAHFLFALGMTVYILIAIRFEERDLVEAHPGYADYRRRVPMLIPRLWLKRPQPAGLPS